MHNDPIVEEVRKARQAYLKRMNYDITALAEDLRKHEQEHSERLVTYPPKPVSAKKTA